MASSLNRTDPTGRKPPSFGIRQFLFVVFLAIIFFLLGQSMVHHRFFETGGPLKPDFGLSGIFTRHIVGQTNKLDCSSCPLIPGPPIDFLSLQNAAKLSLLRG
jgi:hypothetical protein